MHARLYHIRGNNMRFGVFSRYRGNNIHTLNRTGHIAGHHKLHAGMGQVAHQLFRSPGVFIIQMDFFNTQQVMKCQRLEFGLGAIAN